VRIESNVLPLLELKCRVIENVHWDRTGLSIDGKEDWIEVSARPAMAMQQFVSVLVNSLLLHHSTGEADFEMRSSPPRFSTG
jgi:hypothetical protein